MVPKLHAKGHSFKGAAAYLLHDKGRAKTDDRVAWTETRNLAVDDPHVAWRVMAATAMDQARLKEDAGVKNTGRKSTAHVLHFTLSWHPDESEGLGRDEMMRAANGALRALGASDRQAIIVAHNDEEQPHMHILANRVSPNDGKMLPSSKEKYRLSRWAQGYEEDRGRIYCDQRVINNGARDRGEFVRGTPDKPRHIFELEQKAGNDNRRNPEQQRRKDAEISRRRHETQKRHAQEWATLEAAHKQRAEEIREATRKQIGNARHQVRQGFKQKWTELHHEHQAQTRQFEQREEKILGRFRNALGAINFKALIRGEGDRKALVRDAFDAFSSSGVRLEALKSDHAGQSGDLARQQKGKENQAADRINAEEPARLAENRERFAQQRATLILAHDMDKAKLKAEWKQLDQDRLAAASEDERTRRAKATPSDGDTRAPSGGRRQQQMDQAGGDAKRSGARRYDAKPAHSRRRTPPEAGSRPGSGPEGKGGV